MNTLLLEYLCKAPDWLKITMGHAGESGWLSTVCMYWGITHWLLLEGSGMIKPANEGCKTDEEGCDHHNHTYHTPVQPWKVIRLPIHIKTLMEVCDHLFTL